MTVKNTRHFAGGKEISVATEVMDMTSVSRRLWPLYPWGYDLCFPEVMTSVSQRLWPLYPRGYDLCFPEVMKSVSRRLWPLFPRGHVLCIPEVMTSVSLRVWPLFPRGYDLCFSEVMTAVSRRLWPLYGGGLVKDTIHLVDLLPSLPSLHTLFCHLAWLLVFWLYVYTQHAVYTGIPSYILDSSVNICPTFYRTYA